MTQWLISNLYLFAATSEQCTDEKNLSLFGIFPRWYKYLEYTPQGVAQRCNLVLDIGDNPGQLLLVGLAVVEILIRLAGLVAVAYIMYGGFKYVMSRGEPENTKQAQQSVINAIVGATIALLAVAFVSYIGRRLGAG